MVNKIVLLVTLILLLGVTSVTAVTYKQDTNINLVHTVRLQDAPTSTANCNITVFDPDNFIQVGFQAMSYDSTSDTYNYTLNKTQTSQFGAYSYDITCLDGGLNKTETFNFFVNPAGRDLATSESILFIFVLIVSLTVFGLFLWASIRIPFRNERTLEGKLISVNFSKHLKLLAITATYSTIVWISFLVHKITSGFIEFTGVSNFFLFIHRISLGFFYPIFTVTLLWIVIVFILDLKLAKKLSEGRLFNINEL